MTDERAIEDRVRARAQEIWEREGMPEGQELRHWDEARAEIEAQERVGADAMPDHLGDAVLGMPSSDVPDILPEAGQGAPNEDPPVETEASPSQLDRTPI